MEGLGNFFSVSLVQSFIDAWDSINYVLVYGGWFLVALTIAGIFYAMWLEKKQHHYIDNIDYVYLDISVPELPSPSILAAELMFAQIHATKKNFNFRERYILGHKPTWFSFEMVSLGGVIRYIIRTPREFGDAVRSAIYSQYPDAEMNEAGDYMEAFNLPYNPDEVDYDLWGTDLELAKNDVYPIKTYPLFEHRAAETIIDPLAALIEDIANIDPEEMLAVQILAQPSGDEWKKHGEEEVKKLKGWHEKREGDTEDRTPISLMQHLSESEKNVITSIQVKLGKLSYLSKVRFLYAAPKDKLKRTVRVPAVEGSFAQFSAFDLNSFKKNKFTATKHDIKLSEKLQGKRASDLVLWKKREFIRNFKGRKFHRGGVRYHLSTEELASLYHFPLEEVRKTTIQKIEARKAEPPVNLPI